MAYLYLDNVIVFARTLREHLKRLCAVLAWMQEGGLKLQPTKYTFFRTRVIYLGHEISKEGVQTDDCKVEAIKDLPLPNMVTEL